MRSLRRWLAVASMAAFVAAGAVVAQKSEKKEGPAKKGLDEPAGLTVDDVVERVMSFDKNKDGKVTKDELPERMHHLIDLGDVNKDGALDRDEIRKLATTLASAPRGPEGGGFGFGFNVRQEGKLRVGGPGPGPGPGFGGHAAGVVEDLKLSGKKKDQALAAVKAHEENVRKLMDKARAELLKKMKEILSEEELNDFEAALDRPRGASTFFVGPREARKDGGAKKLEQPKK